MSRQQRLRNAPPSRNTRKGKAVARGGKAIHSEEEADSGDTNEVYVEESSQEESDEGRRSWSEPEVCAFSHVCGLPDVAKVNVKLHPQEPSKKGSKRKPAGKAKANDTGDNDDGIPKDFLSQEPIKGFLQRAQQEFRIYLATENAWPRKKSQHIQKMEVPQDVMLNTVQKFDCYQTPQFKETFDRLWAAPRARDKMARQVSLRHFCFVFRLLYAVL